MQLVNANVIDKYFFTLGRFLLKCNRPVVSSKNVPGAAWLLLPVLSQQFSISVLSRIIKRRRARTALPVHISPLHESAFLSLAALQCRTNTVTKR